MTFSVFVFSLLAGKVLFKTFSEKQKIFLLNYLFSLPGMTAEEVSSLGETITVHSMCFQDRRLTPITSRYEGMWDKCLENDKNIIIRWRMSAVLGTMRRGASSSPATPLTRWTRSPVSSATTKWSFLKGVWQISFHSFFIPSFPLQISAHWRDVLHLPPAAHACLYPGQGGGPHQLPVRGLHGLPGGLDLQTPVQEQQLHQGLGRLTAHPRHHVQLRHLRRGPLLCREIEGKSGVTSGLWQVPVGIFLSLCLLPVYLLWAACHPSWAEVQLLLWLQSDGLLSSVRCPGLPLRQAPEALLPNQGRHHQDERH